MWWYLVFILKGFANESKKHTIVFNGLQGEGMLLGVLNHISMALTTIKFLLLLGLLLQGSFQRAINLHQKGVVFVPDSIGNIEMATPVQMSTLRFN
jgi:hypothetical protein